MTRAKPGPIRVTFDTNALINMQLDTGDAKGLSRLMRLHSKGDIVICIPAIIASENRPGGSVLQNYSEFQAFMSSLDIRGYEELNPMWYLGVGYLGHCLIAGDEMLELEQRIHEILFPNIPYTYRDLTAKGDSDTPKSHDRKWRNAKCDVQAIWSHIYHKADVFVTEDSNFHKKTKKGHLVQLGARNICTPSECASMLESSD